VVESTGAKKREYLDRTVKLTSYTWNGAAINLSSSLQPLGLQPFVAYATKGY
jgi:hypothetical protein